MLWFRNKLAEQFAGECSELRGELARETQKRIAAETLSEERRIQAERAEQFARDSMKARDEAVSGRLESLNLVNKNLLEALAPEKAPQRSIKDFSAIPPKPDPRKQAKKMADAVIEKLVAEGKRRANTEREPQEQSAPEPPPASVQ